MVEFSDNAPKDRPALQEELALRMRNDEAARAGWPPVSTLDDIEDPELYRRRAAEALEALDAMQVHMAPLPASQAMSAAGYDALRDVGGPDFVEDGAHHVLQSMLLASPYAPGRDKGAHRPRA